MARIAHHPAAQRLGKALGHLGKGFAGGALNLLLPVPENLPLTAVVDVRRVLLVRPNFRIGNTLITSPLVPALRRRFPGVRLDYLTGDTTAALLAHLPIDEVHTVSRRFITRPWEFAALFARLRRNRYDVAVEAGLGSFSGGLYTFLAGARFRIGCGGRGDRFLNVRLPPVETRHVYDSPVAFARLLGSDCADHPLYAVGREEEAAAAETLRQVGLARGEDVLPHAAVFVGGHQDKRWPAAQWLEMAGALARAGARLAIYLGPEELHFAEAMRTGLGAAVPVIPPRPLRLFAALWSQASLIVTPDSGPMHLAAALGVPTVAILQSEGSLIYGPRRPDDRALLRPSVGEAVEAVRSHPAWSRIVGRGFHPPPTGPQGP